MSRAWGTKPAPTGIKASIQSPFVPILIFSTPASPPSRVPRAAQLGLTFPSRLSTHIRARPQSRWPQSQGQDHLFFLKGPAMPAGSELGPVLSAPRLPPAGLWLSWLRRKEGSEARREGGGNLPEVPQPGRAGVQTLEHCSLFFSSLSGP